MRMRIPLEAKRLRLARPSGPSLYVLSLPRIMRSLSTPLNPPYCQAEVAAMKRLGRDLSADRLFANFHYVSYQVGTRVLTHACARR